MKLNTWIVVSTPSDEATLKNFLFIGQKQYHKPDIRIWSSWRSKSASEVQDLESLTISWSQMYPDSTLPRIRVRMRVEHMPPVRQHDFQGKNN